MNLLSRCKACIFYRGEKKSVALDETKFICMSRDKNNLQFYHLSTFYKVVKLRDNERYIRKMHHTIPNFLLKIPNNLLNSFESIPYFSHTKVI